jgi:Holliday junction resolvase RusA-like endonuclease
LIALAAQEAMKGAPPHLGPIALSVTATFPIPSSWSKKRIAGALWHTGRPDGDNLLKAVGDGLNGVAWKDDSQVASARIVKIYELVPGLEVQVTPL